MLIEERLTLGDEGERVRGLAGHSTLAQSADAEIRSDCEISIGQFLR